MAAVDGARDGKRDKILKVIEDLSAGWVTLYFNIVDLAIPIHCIDIYCNGPPSMHDFRCTSSDDMFYTELARQVDKYDVRIMQLLKLLRFPQHFAVNHAAMEPCPVHIRAGWVTLYFNHVLYRTCEAG